MDLAEHDDVKLPPRHPGAGWAYHLRAAGWIVAVVALVGFFDLGGRDLRNSMEIGFALTVDEMVREGDWVLPHINGQPRWVKPPLPFWVPAAVCELLHGDRAPIETLRAVSLLMACATALCVYWLGQRMFDRRAGLWSGLVWATCLLSVLQYRYATHDIYLAAAIALSMVGVWKAWARERGGWLVTAIGFTLAFQAKGPVSWVLTVLPAVVFAFTRRPPRWRFVPGLIGLAVASGLTLVPWLFAVAGAMGRSVIDLYWWEGFGRVADQQFDDSPLTYLEHFGYVLPWTLYLLAGLIVPFQRKYAARADGLWFCWLWLVVGLVALTIPQERAARYALPLIAPAALLVGQILSFHADLWRRRRMADPGAEPLWIGHTILLACCAIGTAVVPAWFGWIGWMGGAAIGLGLLIAAAATGLAFRRGHALAGAIGAVTTAGALLLAFSYVDRIAPESRQPFRELAPALAEATRGRPLYAWPEKPPYALIYYARRAAPTIGPVAFGRSLLTDADRAAVEAIDHPDRKQRRHMQAALTHRLELRRWLEGRDDPVIYLIIGGPHEGDAVDVVTSQGYTPTTARDLSIVDPRDGQTDRWLLIRLERREAAWVPPRPAHRHHEPRP